MKRADLELLDRDALIHRAEALGVARAGVLTRPELIDEVLTRTAIDDDPASLSRSRGLFGRARDLLARVIERGLHLPDAADRIRPRTSSPPSARRAPAAVPTVTLAEIYAAQGHKERALETLRRVIEQEPEHAVARALLGSLETAELPDPPLPPEPDDDAEAGQSKAGRDADGKGPLAAAEALGASAVTSPTGAALGSSRPAGASAVPDASAKARALAEATEPQEPLGMLDDNPLPEKYDVDECVAIPVDPKTVFVYWEIRAATLEGLRRKRPGGVVCLRILVIEPTWDGPRTHVRDHDVGAILGDWFVRDLPLGCVVRAGIGWREGAAFLPASHSPPLEVHPSEASPIVAETLMRWTPEGAAPIRATDADVAGIQRALDRVQVETRRARRGGSSELMAGPPPASMA